MLSQNPVLNSCLVTPTSCDILTWVCFLETWAYHWRSKWLSHMFKLQPGCLNEKRLSICLPWRHHDMVIFMFGSPVVAIAYQDIFQYQDRLSTCTFFSGGYTHYKDNHHSDVTLNARASQITCVSICSGADKKNQSSASLAFAGGIHRWQVDYHLMTSPWL